MHNLSTHNTRWKLQ